MDPFNQVKDDALDQVQTLTSFVKRTDISTITSTQQSEFQSQLSELNDTIDDLRETVDHIKSDRSLYPDVSDEELESRDRIIQNLHLEYEKISSQLKIKAPLVSNNPFASYEDEIDNEVKNSVNRDVQLQQELSYQDEQIDGVYDSVQRINQQARIMGNELEEQAGLIDEFEQDMDRTQGRLGRSVKRLNVIMEKNRERFNDCCIMMLIGLLIILLVLIIVL